MSNKCTICWPPNVFSSKIFFFKEKKREAIIAENYTSYLLDEVTDMTKTLTMLHCYAMRILCER